MTNQPYRVRLKTKTKIRIFLVLVALISFMSIAFWTLVTSSVFKQKDEIVHSNFMLVYPEKCSLRGKLTIAYAKKCQLKLAEGVYFEAFEVQRFNEEGYCIAQLFKNGEFIEFVLQPRELCD